MRELRISLFFPSILFVFDLQLGFRIVMHCFSTNKAPPNHPKPRPIFVWSGRDAIERAGKPDCCQRPLHSIGLLWETIHEILNIILVTLVAEDKRQVCDSKMVAKEKYGKVRTLNSAGGICAELHRKTCVPSSLIDIRRWNSHQSLAVMFVIRSSPDSKRRRAARSRWPLRTELKMMLLMQVIPSIAATYCLTVMKRETMQHPIGVIKAVEKGFWVLPARGKARNLSLTLYQRNGRRVTCKMTAPRKLHKDCVCIFLYISVFKIIDSRSGWIGCIQTVRIGRPKCAKISTTLQAEPVLQFAEL